ncbi:MAG: hypothetical protein ACPGJV_08830 [Bacteriovoracaceae bacterium]
MFSRSEKDAEKFVQIPEDKLQEYEKSIKEVYGAQLDLHNKSYKLYGFIYPGEFVLVISLKPNDEKSVEAPTTFFCSIELKKDSQSPSEKILLSAIDYVGLFLDEYIQHDSWSDYFQVWEKDSFNGTELFHKITREDIGLTLQASQLLNQ